MSKFKQKLKELQFYKKPQFWIFVFITILFFGNLYKMEFATDTYSMFTAVDGNVSVFMRAGRFVTALILQIFFTLGFSNNLVYTSSYIIAMIAITTSMYKFYKIIRRDIKNEKISIIISILTILNIFIIELMLFIEKGIMTLSILFNVLAFEQLLKVFDGHKKNIIGAFIYMLLANCSYQGTVALFVMLAMVYIIKYSKNIKDFLLKNILTALLYGIPAALNYLSVRVIFPSSRVTGNIVLKESIRKILLGICSIFKSTCRIIPPYVFLGFIIFIILIIMYKICKDRLDLSQSFIKMAAIIYIFLGTIITCSMPQLLQNTESIWMVPRTMYAIVSLIGIMLLFLYTNFSLEKALEKIIVVISIIYISIQYINFQKIIDDRYILNYEDKMIVTYLENKIEQYEAENIDKKVTKIVLLRDKNMMYTYEGLFITGDMNIRAFATDWSAVEIINYYTGRNLEVVDPDEEILNQFADKDWNMYSPEQIIIHEDTVYVCVF